MKKITYKVRNWSEYNKSLEQRGSLSVWIPKELIAEWFSSESRAGRGTSQIYSNSAIEFCLILRHLYHQPLRQTRGFVASLFQLMGLDLPVPCYSTVCRRAQQLELCIRSEKTLKEPLNIAFDGTGVKVFGEGEWKVRTHGADKRRTWVKLHLTIDTETQEIIAAVVTGSEAHDSEVLGDMLEQIPERIQDGFGDGAYDSKECHELLVQRQALATIPPRDNAVIHSDSVYPSQRNQHVAEIQSIGKEEWKVKHRYHQRSKSETAFSRLKRIFGERIPSRLCHSQALDLFIRCLLLNRFFELGKPVSFAVAN